MNFPAKHEEMPAVMLSRRTFVTFAGSLLAYLSTRRAHAVPFTSTQEKKMDITRVGS